MIDRWRYKLQDTTLFGKIMVSLLVFAILPLNIFYFVSLTTTERIMTEMIHKDTLASLRLVSGSVDSLLGRMASAALFLDQDSNIDELLFGERFGPRSEQDYLRLQTINQVNSTIQNMMFNAIDAQGYITIMLPDQLFFANHSYPYEERQKRWKQLDGLTQDQANYINWKGGEPNYVASERASSPYLVTIEKAIDNNKTSGEYGWLTISLFETEFRRLLADKSFDHDRFLIDSSCTVVSSTDPNLLGRSLNQVADTDRMRNAGGYFVDASADPGRRIVTYAEIPRVGWRVVDLRDDSVLSGAIREHRNLYLFVNSICIFVFALIALAIARGITLPIQRLTGEMRGITLEPTGESRGFVRNEVGLLEDSFHKMKGDIHELIEANRVKERKKRKAELHALQSQISPHFLFNTLNSVRWLSVENGNDSAAEIAFSLSKLLKTTISHTDEFISVGDELENVRNYVRILNLRHSKTSELIVNVPEEILHHRVPKLILQPIVENAILHGFDGLRRQGVVTIEGERQGEELHIVVEDNGKGIVDVADPDETGKKLKASTFTGIGISNVDERIRNHFGEQYGLTIENNPGKGVRVSLRLPGTQPAGGQSPHRPMP